jgi:hypothetical protein
MLGLSSEIPCSTSYLNVMTMDIYRAGYTSGT